MCANDECEWMKREIDWLDVPLAEEKPFLGICLGAQMLARALGARVFTYEDKRSEIGYVPIEPNAAADRLCAEPFPRSVYQWHTDGFDLPKGAELLATGAKDFPNQAYRYGQKAVGLQFHPEVTYHMMCRWTIRGDERLTRPGRAAAPAPARRLVPARRAGRRLARRLPAGLDGGAARRSVRAAAPRGQPPEAGRDAEASDEPAGRSAGRTPGLAAELVS